jgi:multiple sugar transport system permease protein
MAGERGFKRALWVVLFLLPSLTGLLLFMIGPILASLGLAFSSWDPLLPATFTFVGLENFTDLFSDANFWAALLHTFTYLVGYIPLVLITGLGAALLLNRRLRGQTIFRAAFFTPVISAWVAVALLWTWIFNPQYGLINFGLGLLGIQGPTWLYDPNWAMLAIVITSVWKDTGYLMAMFLNGLQNIPDEYYEAAAIDGASNWDRFRYITLPMLSPTTFFALIISLISSFQVFDQVWIMTAGGPGGATTTVVEEIVNNAFHYNRMGYAASLSWVLFLLVFLATIVQSSLQRKWVVYE